MVPTIKREQTWLPNLFNDFFDDNLSKYFNTTSPAVNVVENDNEYRVEIAAPGMSKDDFKIRIDEDNELVVSMEKKEEDNKDRKDEKYLRREFSYSKFEQSLLLPDDIKKDEIQANMKHGVLNIYIPKDKSTPAAPKTQYIEIK